jgi:hypothetical protein
MLEPGKAPDAGRVAEWIGAKASAHWAELSAFIESQCPGVFDRDWLFGGKKWGWSLRFKRSKSFCTLIPERGRFKALLIFGAEEREKVDGILPELASHPGPPFTARPYSMPLMAVRRRRARGTLIHSDQGTQYGSDAWRRFCRSNRLEPSMSRKGNCWDNAVAESFFSSLKKERIKNQIYKNRELAIADVADYIDTFYNGTRRHSHLGGLSPEQFEAAHKPRRQGVH